jgi:hypothetical protein
MAALLASTGVEFSVARAFCRKRFINKELGLTGCGADFGATRNISTKERIEYGLHSL